MQRPNNYFTVAVLLIAALLFAGVGIWMTIELGQAESDGSQASMIAHKNFRYVLITAICLIVVTLLVIGSIYIKSRKRLSEITHQNAIFRDSLVDCLIVCNAERKITDFNEAALNVFGVTTNEMRLKSIYDLFVSKEEADKVGEALENKGVFKGEIHNIRKNGESFVSFLSANSIYDTNGKVIGTIGISRDITEQRLNEERFQHIVDNATDIIYTTNVNGELTYINSSANSVLGYSDKEFLGMSFQQLIHPDDQEWVEEHYSKQFKNREKETYLECKMLKANGEPIWIGQNVRTSFSPVEPDKITGFYGILRNLDDIKKTQIELAASEQRYRELFDNSTDLIQSVDPIGNILYVNQSWIDVLGYSKEEIKRTNLYDILHDDSKTYCENLLTDILMNGETSGDEEHLFKMLTKDGRLVVLKGGLSITYEHGQVQSLQAFMRDVTEHQKVEEALRKSEENFRLISENINDVFFLYNIHNSSYEFISPNCENVLGARPDFFYDGGNHAEIFVVPEDRKIIAEAQKSIRSGEVCQIEYRMLLNGELNWISEKWFPIRDEYGNVSRTSGICRNITDVKEAYETIYDQNHEITQSIRYAKNIQESTLPTEEELKAILPDSFVFYRAKDVLSGDLYLVDVVETNEGQSMAVFAVGDCTGHGVPGGVLSLLCSGLLTESLTSKKVNSPSEALDFVRAKLIRLFRSNKSKHILDGMDAAFCALDRSKNELLFSGANLSCYIIRGDEVHEYKGDKQHIGYSSAMAPFVKFSIDVEEGDLIYLTTDGFMDQFGGPKNKKFLKKRFTQLLLDVRNESMAEQEKRIKQAFFDWKGDEEQTDDISLIGVRV